MSTIPELFQRAMQFHQSGNLAQAEPLYRQILQAEPSNPEAYHLLGLLAHQAGHPEPAIALLRQAVALNPASDGVHFNLGIVLMSRGNWVEGGQSFRQVLQLNPRHVEAHINLGNALLNLGQLDDAARSYRQALRIQPHHADAHINLGNALMNQGKNEEASACYREALRINPRHAHGHNNLGNALLGLGQRDEATLSYRQALRLDPANVKAHYNLGNVLKDQGKMAEAADCYRQALRIQPLHADALNNLGIILRDQGQPAEAVRCYREALRINPNQADAYNNLGNALKDLGQIAEAAECYRQVLRLNPNLSANCADAYNNLGLAYKDQRKFAEAAECFQQAIDIDPGHSMALWNRCLLRLLHGDFEGAWPDHEQRWAQPGMVPRPFQQPRWDGSPLKGKTLLVYVEMGLGDTIHFLRFLPMVKERGGTVLLECQPSLCQVLTGYKGVDQLIPAGTPLPPFDVQIPLLSLPALFGTTIATIPKDNPYLAADPKLVENWQEELRRAARRKPAGQVNEPEGAFKVGIAWQSNAKHIGHRHKSFTLSCFEPLARVQNVQLVSLQVGLGTEQLAAATFPVLDLGSRFEPHSLQDLAAVLMNLDLVVTVDTAVGHLAGALGVPVWVALPFVACWRWQLDRDDTLWYPTMRLFRQKQPGDWHEVFGKIAAELQKKSEET